MQKLIIDDLFLVLIRSYVNSVLKRKYSQNSKLFDCLGSLAVDKLYNIQRDILSLSFCKRHLRYKLFLS